MDDKWVTDKQCNIELTDFGMDFDIFFSLNKDDSVEVSATVFLSDWHVSQHPERSSGHSSLLSFDSCICFMHSLLWWTGRLVNKRGMSALIYSLPGKNWWRYLNPISVTTSPSCMLTGCSPPYLCRWLWIHLRRVCLQLYSSLLVIMGICFRKMLYLQLDFSLSATMRLLP